MTQENTNIYGSEIQPARLIDAEYRERHERYEQEAREYVQYLKDIVEALMQAPRSQTPQDLKEQFKEAATGALALYVGAGLEAARQVGYLEKQIEIMDRLSETITDLKYEIRIGERFIQRHENARKAFSADDTAEGSSPQTPEKTKKLIDPLSIYGSEVQPKRLGEPEYRERHARYEKQARDYVTHLKEVVQTLKGAPRAGGSMSLMDKLKGAAQRALDIYARGGITSAEQQGYFQKQIQTIDALQKVVDTLQEQIQNGEDFIRGHVDARQKYEEQQKHSHPSKIGLHSGSGSSQSEHAKKQEKGCFIL